MIIPEITLKNVSVEEKGKLVLNNVSLHIQDKEYIGLLGPTGSGPSYVLKVISGLIPVKSGQIFFDDEDVTHKLPEDRNIGYIFEQFNLFPHLSVMDNLLFGPKMRRQDLDEKQIVAREIISMVRLDGRENAISKELSGGMQQRVGIARAVTAGAKILLLDQPYRALDAKIREEMRFEIREIVKDLRLTAIHSTHEAEEAMITSDRVAVFNEGKIDQIADPEELYNSSATKFVSTFLAESNIYRGTVEGSLLEINGFKFSISKSFKEHQEINIIIRQHAVNLSITSMEDENVFQGKITKVRLLGEFIRFEIALSDSFTIISRQMLALRWQDPYSLIGKSIFISIPSSAIQIF